MQKSFVKFMSMRWALPLAFSSLVILAGSCGNTSSEEAAAPEATETVAPAPEATTDTAASTGDTTGLPPVDTSAASKPVGDKQPPRSN